MSVSAVPVDWQTRPSDNVAVAQTAAEPTFTPVTVVENGLLPSFVGLTVATDVLYDPNAILFTLALPSPLVTLALTVPVLPLSGF